MIRGACSLRRWDSRWGVARLVERSVTRNGVARALSWTRSVSSTPAAMDSSASVARVRAELTQGTVLLEYVILPERLVIFALDERGLSATEVHVTSQALKKRIEELRRALANRRSTPADIRKSAGALHSLLLRPVRQRIGAAARVVIVADGRLQGVPFSALVDEDTGSYFVEKVVLVKAPSASVFLRPPEPTIGVLFARTPRRPSSRILPSIASRIRNCGSCRSLTGKRRRLQVFTNSRSSSGAKAQQNFVLWPKLQ